LSPFEVDALLICLAPEIDLRYERLFGYLQDDVTKRRPSVDLLLNLLSPTFESKLSARQYFSIVGDDGSDLSDANDDQLILSVAVVLIIYLISLLVSAHQAV
jgi:hypothetical protein